MENVLELSINSQNELKSTSLFKAIFHDTISGGFADSETIADYLLADYDACPENWNCCFEYSYDEISSLAKEQRRNVIVNMLVMEGYLPTETE